MHKTTRKELNANIDYVFKNQSENANFPRQRKACNIIWGANYQQPTESPISHAQIGRFQFPLLDSDFCYFISEETCKLGGKWSR